MRPRIYIACPLSRGDLLQNIRQADAAFLALQREGFAPFNPAWSVYCDRSMEFPRYSGNRDRSKNVAGYGSTELHILTHAEWMAIDLAWVAVADAVLRLPGPSAGADEETAFARSRGIPVFESVEAVVEWNRSRVMDALADVINPVRLPAWMNRPLEAFVGKTPQEVLDAGRGDLLMEIAYRLGAGEPV